MNIPDWYRIELAVWLFTGLPFQWFFTAFNGLPFFSLPDSPGPNGPPVVLWLGMLIFLYHPIFMGAFVLCKSWTRKLQGKQ